MDYVTRRGKGEGVQQHYEQLPEHLFNFTSFLKSYLFINMFNFKYSLSKFCVGLLLQQPEAITTLLTYLLTFHVSNHPSPLKRGSFQLSQTSFPLK